MVKRNSTRTSAHVRKVTSKVTSAGASVVVNAVRELTDIKQRLEAVRAVTVLAIEALEAQAADIDLDVSGALRRSVREALVRPITKLGKVARDLEAWSNEDMTEPAERRSSN